MSGTTIDRALISRSVKRIVIAESGGLYIDPEAVADDEPLNGTLLKVNSFAFVGMLVRLEDDLGITLADDLFVGRTFYTVGEVIEMVNDCVGTAS